jgi:hypothetical protein
MHARRGPVSSGTKLAWLFRGSAVSRSISFPVISIIQYTVPATTTGLINLRAHDKKLIVVIFSEHAPNFQATIFSRGRRWIVCLELGVRTHAS